MDQKVADAPLRRSGRGLSLMDHHEVDPPTIIVPYLESDLLNHNRVERPQVESVTAQKFPRAASLRTALSKIRSATSPLNLRACSSRIPPYPRLHR